MHDSRNLGSCRSSVSHPPQASASQLLSATTNRIGFRATIQRLVIATCKMIAVSPMIALTVGLSAQAAFSQGPVSDQQQYIDTVAVVNGSQITRSQLGAECMSRHGEDVIKNLINRQLIINHAERWGIQVSHEEINNEIQKISGGWGISSDRWLALLKTERNVDEQKYRDYVWTTLMLKKIAAEEITVTAEEVDRVLMGEIGPKVQARLISCLTREKAEQAWEEVNRDPEAFGRVARQFSDDPISRANSGLISPIQRFSGTPEFEEAAFALQVGEISPILELGGQYVFIRCEGITPATEISPAQEQYARSRIVDHLYDQKLGNAAGSMFERMQQNVTVINTYNDPQLQAQYPGIAAIVGGQTISIDDVMEECISRHGVPVLEGEVNRVLLLQELQRHGIEVTEADVSAEIAKGAAEAGFKSDTGSPQIEDWLAYVKEESGASVEHYVRDAVWPSVALKLLVDGNPEVTEEDLQKAWEANFGPRVEALAIFQQNMREASRIFNLAMANPTAQFFGELANQYSSRPGSQQNYGKIPPIHRFGGNEQLEQEAFALQPDEISGLIPLGEDEYVILFCLGHTEPVVTDRNDPQIREELYNDIYEKKLRLEMARKFADIIEHAQIDNFLTGTTSSGKATYTGRLPETDRGRVPFGPAGVDR